MSKIEFQQELSEVNKNLQELKKSIQSLQDSKEPVEFITRQQAADMLHINLATLWKYTKDGLLTSYGIQSRVYYKRNEIEASVIELKK